MKHLQRYLDEVQFKFNNREAESLFLLVIIRLLVGVALPYKVLTANSDGAEVWHKIKPGDEPF